MSEETEVGFVSLFRLPSFLLVTSIAGIVLGSLGIVANLFFLYEAGKSLLSASSRRNGRMTATMASIGRMLFLAVSLVFVLRIGLVAFISACGGLLAGQVNLQLVLLIEGRIRRRC